MKKRVDTGAFIITNIRAEEVFAYIVKKDSFGDYPKNGIMKSKFINLQSKSAHPIKHLLGWNNAPSLNGIFFAFCGFFPG